MNLEYLGKIRIPQQFSISQKTKIHQQNGFLIGVLVLKGHQQLIFFKILLEPCCEAYYDHLVELRLPSQLTTIFFMSDFSIALGMACQIWILRLELIYDTLKLSSIQKIQRCFDKLAVVDDSSKLIMMYNDQLTVLNLSGAPNSGVIAKLPLFYQNLSFLKLKQKHVIHVKNKNLYGILLKDLRNRVVLSLYDMSKNYHQALLFSQYLKSNGQFIQATQLQNSQFALQAAYLYTLQNPQLLFYFQGFQLQIRYRTTNSLAIYQKNNQIKHFYIKTKPGIDSITDQLKPLLKGSELQCFLQYNVLNSGFIARDIYQFQQYNIVVDPTQEIQFTAIGLLGLFRGAFLHYQVQCKQQKLCDQAIGLVTPFSFQRIDLNALMKSRITRQIFDYRSWIVSVDNIDVFVGLKKSATSQPETKEFISLRKYGLTNVTYAFSFTDYFGDAEIFYIWVVEAQQVGSNQQVIAGFNVIRSEFDEDEDLVTLHELGRVQSSKNIIEMRYSETWDVVVALYESSNGINNEIDVFSIQYDPHLRQPSISFAKNINSFTFSLSPFFIQSVALHEQLPIIFLGLNQQGLLAIHLRSFQVIFFLDIVDIINVMSLKNPTDSITITGINFLGPHLMSVFVNRISIFQFSIYYRLTSLTNSNIVVVVPPDLVALIQGGIVETYSQEQTPDPAIENLIELALLSKHLTPGQCNAVQIWGAHYNLVWLALDPITLNWYINFFNFLNHKSSKEFLSIFIIREANCLDFQEDQAGSNYPYFLIFYVYCVDFEENSYVWRYVITLNPSLQIDTKKLSALSQNQKFSFKVTATSELTNSTAEQVITLSFTSEPVELKKQVIGLCGVIFLLILVVFIYESLVYWDNTHQKYKEDRLISFYFQRLVQLQKQEILTKQSSFPLRKHFNGSEIELSTLQEIATTLVTEN